MVIVDSSALIPLSWVGRLDLITETFDEIQTPEGVREEVVTEGKRGASTINSFLADVAIAKTPSNAEEVAALEGIAVTDAAMILLAEENTDRLLANDKALIKVARSHGVGCWWVTTLLRKCRKEKLVSTRGDNASL